MRRRSLMLLGAVALVLAGCGTEGGADTTAAVDEPAATDSVETTTAETMAETTTAETMVETTTAETMAETTTPETADGSAAAGGAAVMVAESDEGEILVDQEGFALYLFVPDDQGESTCYDDCEANWPPLAGEVEAGEGVDASLLGTTDRTDGTTQATYDGWPLYYFANDAAPGDVNGQGVNDVWFLVSPSGEGIGMP
jgi:predicted lipoprotein with Yx(FWY)xxD motif